jgi:hypothetical protein
VAREGGAGIEPRVLTPGALRTEAATVAAIREALAGEGEVAIFFDDRETSETYTERITSCPACSRRLEHKNLKMVTYPA